MGTHPETDSCPSTDWTCDRQIEDCQKVIVWRIFAENVTSGAPGHSKFAFPPSNVQRSDPSGLGFFGGDIREISANDHHPQRRLGKHRDLDSGRTSLIGIDNVEVPSPHVLHSRIDSPCPKDSRVKRSMIEVFFSPWQVSLAAEPSCVDLHWSSSPAPLLRLYSLGDGLLCSV